MTGDKTILVDHKKNEINSFTDEAVGDYGSKMHVTTQPDADAEPDSHVSTSTEQREIVSTEPPSKVKKNHLSNLVTGSIDDFMVTRKRYMNLIKFVCLSSLIEPKIKSLILEKLKQRYNLQIFPQNLLILLVFHSLRKTLGICSM